MSRVLITDGVLTIDGKPVFLYGGEVQYFRLRDKKMDPARTHDIWKRTLDLVKAASFNLVTTYVPWDWHEPEEGRFDFSGAKNLGLFIELCDERGLHVQIKPGPLITAEWPSGPGSFGAVPEWFKIKHPEALMSTSKGKTFSFHPLGKKSQKQPSILHPAYLEKVQIWYEKFAEVVKPYIGPEKPVFSVQIDNETNLYWSDHYLVDHHPVAIQFYRDYLKGKYSEIGELNKAHEAGWKSFDEIEPPLKPPRKDDQMGRNRIHSDWFDAAYEMIGDYLGRLRKMLEDQGISESDVLYTTNDTPGLLPIIDWKILMYNGKLKNRYGLAGLDCYPRCSPLSRAVLDLPFHSGFYTKLYDFYSDAYPLKTGRFVFGAELQGGIMKPPVIKIPVWAESTLHQQIKCLSHGMKAVAVYILAEGLNANNSKYHFQASIDYKGRTNDRYEVLKTIAEKLTAPHGVALLKSEEMEADVVLLVEPEFLAPMTGGEIPTQKVFQTATPGTFGLLKLAGYNPYVADVKDITPDRLKSFKAAVYASPGIIPASSAGKLLDYIRSGGTLLMIGWPPVKYTDGSQDEILDTLLKSVMSSNEYQTLSRPTLKFNMEEGTRFMNPKGRSASFQPAITAKSVLWHGTGVLKGDENTVAAISKIDKGRFVLIAAELFDEFSSGFFYKVPQEELKFRKLFIRRILEGEAGVSPVVTSASEHAEVVVRTVPDTGEIFVFIINDSVLGRKISVQFSTGRQRVNFSAEALFTEQALGEFSAEDINDGKLEIELSGYLADVIYLKPINNNQ